MFPRETSLLIGKHKYGHSVNEDPLAVIYNKTQWRLCTVTALHNFQYDAVKLKQYASKIKQNIVSTITTKNSSLTYSVKIHVGEYLKYSEDDADAIFIEVYTTHTENPTCVYEAIIFSWGVSEDVPDSIHLPYLLDRGKQKLVTAVRNSLSTLFDCVIKQLCLSQNLLLYIGIDCIEYAVSNANNKIISLNFTFSKAANKDKIMLQYEIGDLQMMFSVAMEESQNKTERAKLAYEMILQQIYETFDLAPTVLELNEIVLPAASIKCNGSVKFKSPEMINCIFTALNEISNKELIISE